MNHILCLDCLDKQPDGVEEKCCSHGCAAGIKCVECGAVREDCMPYWSCLGTMDTQRHGEGQE